MANRREKTSTTSIDVALIHSNVTSVMEFDSFHESIENGKYAEISENACNKQVVKSK